MLGINHLRIATETNVASLGRTLTDENLRAVLIRNDSNGEYWRDEDTDEPLTRADLLESWAWQTEAGGGEWAEWLADGMPCDGVTLY